MENIIINNMLYFHGNVIDSCDLSIIVAVIVII